jgi:signal transduction histidine kinase/CheY-like chemotaxis protein
MTLRRRTAVIVAFAMLGAVGVLIFVGRTLVGGGFQQLEDSYAERDGERMLRAIERETDQLSTTALDWASWDDTYNYVQAGSEAYEDSNLGQATLEALHLSLMAIVGLDGRPVYAEVYDGAGEALPFPGDLLSELGMMQSAAPANEGTQGVLPLADGILLVATRPVLRSDDSGPPAGTLVMGRWLDDSLLAALSQQTVASARLVKRATEPDAFERFDDAQGYVEPLDGEWTATYALLPTLVDDGSYAIETLAPRDISQKGVAVVSNLAWLLLAAGVFFGLTTFASLEVGVIRRLRRIGTAVHSVGSDPGLGRRLGMGASDEVGRLAGDIDNMLDSLERAERRYAQLVENAVDGIVQLRGEAIAFANPSAIRLLGIDESGRPSFLGDYFAPGVRARLSEAIAGAASGANLRFEAEVAVPGGTLRVIEMSITALEHEPGCAQVMLRDQTEKVATARARQEFERQMMDTQRLESVGLLAGGIAHDFNNLLMVVLGNASLLEPVVVEPEGRRALDELRLASTRASELTHQLLAYAGRGVVKNEPIELAALARETTELAARIAGKLVGIEVESEPGPSTIVADPTQIKQVVLNLITNALDALGGSNGRVHVRTGRSVHRLAGADGVAAMRPSIYVEVSDNGVGMTPEVQARMFEPFFSTKGTGRGLGLAALLGAVRGAGGDVQVRSAPGDGTTIRVYFPASSAAVPAAEAAAVTSRQEAPGAERRVLVVDDEPAVRQVTARLLERAGYAVTQAADGYAAMEVLEGSLEFDTCVVDMAMPGIDGTELVRRMRARGIVTPVLMVSGYADVTFDPDDAVSFLRKPFGAGELTGAVESVLAAA